MRICIISGRAFLFETSTDLRKAHSMPKEIHNITVLGDGAWGTALAQLAVTNTHNVTVWGHDADYLDQMQQKKENFKFLPGVSLSPMLEYTSDMKYAVAKADLIICAIPTIFLRQSFAGMEGIIPENTGVISVVKGIEQETLLRPTQIIAECLKCKRIGVLAGPSHAEEVSRGCPTTVVVASEDEELTHEAQEALKTPLFRVYRGGDPLGIELSGALKNVMALTAGACAALNLGDNATAALLTRGLAEMTRLGVAMGADVSTFYGLAGLGDLVVTCFSEHSRNRRFGYEAVKSDSRKYALESHEYIAEGYFTAKSAYDLSKKYNVEMPIIEQINRVLFEDHNPRTAVFELMGRSVGAES